MRRGSTEIRTWYSDVPSNVSIPTITGFLVLIVAVFGFGAWAGTAPIDGAVVAPGTFVATGQNKHVQHLEGGVIDEILVREGDVVEPGQTMIRLDETAPKAQLRRLVLRLFGLKAMEARLHAAAELKEEIAFADDLTATTTDPDIHEIIGVQRVTFQTRRDTLTSQIEVHQRGIAALRERINGYQAQFNAIGDQLEYVAEEMEAKNELLRKGHLKKPEILALQRAQAKLEGEAGRLRAEIGDAKEQIARTERLIAHEKKVYVQEAVDQLQGVEGELQDVRQRIRSAQNVLDRVDIIAPVKGVVVALRYHTSGGVIEPGKDILELLPIGDELIIEAEVRPQDIENVKKGQEAVVRLSALSQRVTPMIPGEVIYVSADTLADERRGALSREDVYVARIRLDSAMAGELNFHPTPGMPTEVYIRTGERTFLTYLLQPVVNSMSRAFRES
ncbi:HlyD family type I secretion periplasmic adaptor subunit [Oricola sp.]|uniref:HlyD family type I secretion periplasmic adaptor subunit n=1 Tax=Oricola sp. TaxID=1979950 RepID=UPI003BABCD89